MRPYPMPVNKLWIEYTERAAWESVEALRKKLAEAEARIQRMAPSTSGWQELFDALDAAAKSTSSAAQPMRPRPGLLGKAG